jgi:putative ABC transport system permease protein
VNPAETKDCENNLSCDRLICYKFCAGGRLLDRPGCLSQGRNAMKVSSVFGLALSALGVHKGRALLTGLGIMIGIAAVIAMVSAGQGVRRELDRRLDRVGRNVILVHAGTHVTGGTRVDANPFTKEDEQAIRKQAGSLLLALAPVQYCVREVVSRYGRRLTDVVGTTPELQKARGWQVASGRYLSDDDNRQVAQVCMLGQSAYKKLFPGHQDPIGERIRVGNLQLRIIGMTAPKGFAPNGVDQDDEVLVPLATLQQRISGGGERVVLLVAGARPDAIEAAADLITRVLRERHRIKADAADDFEVSTVKEMAEFGDTLADTLEVLLAVIASLSLVVGGVGIMNIMLVSVTERTREIGIRMALGATPRNILTQFLLEAVVLAALGGILGITLGIGGAAALARALNWPLVVSPSVMLIAVVASVSVGIFFGSYPAWKASRLDPIDALRFE